MSTKSHNIFTMPFLSIPQGGKLDDSCEGGVGPNLVTRGPTSKTAPVAY